MPTPNETKALLFLAGVALLGGAVRLAASVRDAARPVPAEDLAALDRQLSAADSASAAAKRERGERGRGKGTGRPPRPERRRPPGEPPAVASAPVGVSPFGGAAPAPAIVVDLDRASAEQVAALPGIGPALAQRIVRWRDSAGGLGGLEALDCVSGVGPALLARVRSHVTFSGARRPSCAAPRATGPRSRSRSR
ncbi:MAG TPA: helix-hairpin-helix domain-containing protein [Gemmatimonadaceae bacterium]|nr:helix-hairpin-helix domain-containing protein [Gemmatimonadaceae bacterium]